MIVSKVMSTTSIPSCNCPFLVSLCHRELSENLLTSEHAQRFLQNSFETLEIDHHLCQTKNWFVNSEL